VTKQKDGSDDIAIGFDVVAIDVSTSALGFENLTSLAVQANTEIVQNTKKNAKNNQGSGGNQRLEMDSLMKVIKNKASYREVEGTTRYGVYCMFIHWTNRTNRTNVQIVCPSLCGQTTSCL
jgi:hypothetical protein